MSQAIASCQLELDRGPEWLFIRVRLTPDGLPEPVPVAEPAWNVIEQHRVYRIVLELDQVALLHSHLIGQIVMLQKRVHAAGGVLRLCGLSPRNQEALHVCRLEGHLPNYANRADAVMGHRPTAPERTNH